MLTNERTLRTALTKGDFMKKKVLAILLVLVLATAGLFAAPLVIPGDVTATLKANIGEYLEHGFNNNTALYQPTITVLDAFGSTAPSFKYGFKTNAIGTFRFTMSVGNFIGTPSGTVKIKSIAKDGVAFTSAQLLSGVYTVLTDSASTSNPRIGESTITITPATVYGSSELDHAGAVIADGETVATAPAGDYTAILTFHIVAS